MCQGLDIEFCNKNKKKSRPMKKIKINKKVKKGPLRILQLKRF